jgi:hypothetical protein
MLIYSHLPLLELEKSGVKANGCWKRKKHQGTAEGEGNPLFISLVQASLEEQLYLVKCFPFSARRLEETSYSWVQPTDFSLSEYEQLSHGDPRFQLKL